MAEWVSFQELKERVSITDILSHYGLLDGLKSQKGGDELVGLCPFHRETRGSFHASVSKNAFNCFSAARGKHGNVLDFVAAKEGVDIRGDSKGTFETRDSRRTQLFVADALHSLSSNP